MKKLIGFVTGFVAALALIFVFNFGANAVNWQWFDTKWEFNYARINLFDEVVEVSVKQWKDYEDSDVVQVVAADGTVYLTSYNNIVLMEK